MPAPNSPIPLINGPLEIDPLARAARHRGRPIKIGGRGFDLLCALAAEPGRTVPATDLMAAVWPKADVQDNNLRVQIKLLRRVIGDEAIVSVPRRGYLLALAADRPRLDAVPEDTAAESNEDASGGAGDARGADVDDRFDGREHCRVEFAPAGAARAVVAMPSQSTGFDAFVRL